MVATVHELASTATAVSYYEKDGYYAKNDPEHRKASFWHGTAAADLNLRGHVVPSRFESVLSGEVPKSDIRLGRIVEGARQHRPGWDITLSAPKSVSLEALVTGDTRVIRAHDEAVRATLDWIERDLLQTRGWDPVTRRRPRVKADGMVVAGFRHLTSRDLDPQLHTHCVLANMTRSSEGTWKSIEPTLIRRSERLIGAHYRNELAARLQALGLTVTPRMVGPVPGFELGGLRQGVPRCLLREAPRDPGLPREAWPAGDAGGDAEGDSPHAPAQGGGRACRTGAAVAGPRPGSGADARRGGSQSSATGRSGDGQGDAAAPASGGVPDEERTATSPPVAGGAAPRSGPQRQRRRG